MNGLRSLKEISFSIRTARKTMGISQKRLAFYAGVSQSTVARIESDIESLNPSYKMIFNITDALNELSDKSEKEMGVGKTAGEIMHKKVVFCKYDDTVKRALELIKDRDFSQLPVVNKSGNVVGTVYQKKLLIEEIKSAEGTKKKKVAEIIDPALPQIDEGTPIRKIKSMMEGYDAILVTEKGKLKGIISVYDMLRIL